MGSMGNGLFLGVRAGKAPKKFGDDKWNVLASRYAEATRGERPETPWGSKCLGLLGYYVALGHEQEQPGVPTLVDPLPLAAGPESWPAPVYKRYLAASAAWVAFAEWAKDQGYRFDAPVLWIVETEVG